MFASLQLRPRVQVAVAALLLGLVSMTAASAPALAQITPAAFAELDRYATTVAIIAAGQRGPAPVVEIATTTSEASSDAVFRRTSVKAAWGLLGIAFAALMALNLTIFRHLRREYAPNRRAE